MAKRVFLAVCIVIVLSAVPAVATAEVRTATITDPIDQQQPSLTPAYWTDVIGASVVYDDATGAVTASITFAQPEDYLSGTVHLTGSCDAGTGGAIPELTISLDDQARATLEGYTSSIRSPVTRSADGATISTTLQNSAFERRDWRCVAGMGSNSLGGAGGDDFSGWFDGYEPGGAHSPCGRSTADLLTTTLLLPLAAGTNPDYYGDTVADNMWGLGTVICRDLTGDGQQELVAQLRCCTGGSLSPWAIFMRAPTGQWRLAYSDVRDTVFQLRMRGREVRAMVPAPYNGACTLVVRYRVVLWNGTRFTSRLTHRMRLHGHC